MPVLLLCRGDEQSRSALKYAIETRYGVSPPVIERINIDFDGRARIQVGPIQSWVPVSARASFAFPTSLRWDFTVKPLGLPVQRGAEAFDGNSYTVMRSGRANEVLDEEIIFSLRCRLWAIAATLLTPLSDFDITLEMPDEQHLCAVNQIMQERICLTLNADGTIRSVSTKCTNPDNNKIQEFRLTLSSEMTEIGEILMPAQITASWDEGVSFEVRPKKVVINPATETMGSESFRLIGQ